MTQFRLIRWLKYLLGMLLFLARRREPEHFIRLNPVVRVSDYEKKYKGDIFKATYHYCKDTGRSLPPWLNEDGTVNEKFSFPSREEFDKRRKANDQQNLK